MKEEYRLVELSVNYLAKKLGYSKEEAKELGIPSENRRAEVIRDGESIKIIPKSHPDNMPFVEIRNPASLEKVLEKYLETVKAKQMKYTQITDNHKDKYFLFDIWKNATASDCVSPEQFVNRYINFIKDDTFSEYDELTTLGKWGKNIVMVKREEAEKGFETPYIMHLSLTDGRYIYNLPWIRYGISTNRKGEKLAYIYALQRKDESPSEIYNNEIKKNLNTANKGVKKYRNVTPSAIAALSIFLGMLEAQGITAIKAPDYLGFRYGKYLNAPEIEKQDEIQTNVTDKFLRNFLRLSDHLNNIKIESVPNAELNSFLCMSLNPYDGNTGNQTIKELYELGLGKNKTHSIKSKDNTDKDTREIS